MALFGLLSSCHKLNPEEPIPAYIKIDSFHLLDTNLVGSNSARITDAWVTMNGLNIGVFELPALIPVLPQEDSNELFIQAGIMMNGMIETRITYPFYNTYIKNHILEPTETYEITPEISYRSPDNINVIYNNDFERSDLKLEQHGDSQIEPRKSTDEARNGNGSLEIKLDTIVRLAQFSTDVTFSYPPASSNPALMMEIDYKCDHPFSIGLELNSGVDTEDRWIVTFTSTEDINGVMHWKKNYINLTGTMSVLNYVEHKLLIGALLTEASEANIYIDNIKIISTK